MRTFRIDFYTRLKEVDEYFSFAEFIDKIETHKNDNISHSSNKYSYTPKRDLQKILRSSCFLLLYNLVESSVRNAILSVYDEIHDKSLKYHELSIKLQDIWLSHKTSQISITKKSIKNWLINLMEEVSINATILLDRDSIQISGNLDYDNIQKIINSYGFFGKISGDKGHIKTALDKVKRERNLLAHGNKTFSQSGEIILMSELMDMKKNISSFIEELLHNIERYINDERYKR